MLTYPHIPGARATDTSQDAAPNSATAAKLRERVIRHLKSNGPSTADECAEAFGLSVLSVRPRLSELKMLGSIRDTGIRRRNSSGKSAAVMEVAA